MKLCAAYRISIACLSTKADMPLCNFFFLQWQINLQMNKIKNKYNLCCLFHLNTSLQNAIFYFKQILLFCQKESVLIKGPAQIFPQTLKLSTFGSATQFLLVQMIRTLLCHPQWKHFFFFAFEWVKLLSSSFGFKPWLWYRRLIWLWFE